MDIEDKSLNLVKITENFRDTTLLVKLKKDLLKDGKVGTLSTLLFNSVLDLKAGKRDINIKKEETTHK